MERLMTHTKESDEVDGYGLFSAFVCRMCRIFFGQVLRVYFLINVMIHRSFALKHAQFVEIFATGCICKLDRYTILKHDDQCHLGIN